ncbi:MAG: hypothetical protein KY476_18765 [Planctomycetes bacterium]|nr:hypothetical protein [Planctomycetota bacterium]
MKTVHAWIIAAAIVVAAALFTVLPLVMPASAAPLHVGHIQGELLRREGTATAHLKCDGFRVELYDTFILVFVDKSKEPTWTDNYVLPIPWEQVEHMSLMPPGAEGDSRE